MPINSKPYSPEARSKHAIIQTGTKEFLLFGGEDNKMNNCADMHFFHTDDQSWKKVTNSKELFEANRAHSTIRKVSEFGILVGGGSIADYQNPFYFFDTRMLSS